MSVQISGGFRDSGFSSLDFESQILFVLLVDEKDKNKMSGIDRIE